MSFVAIKRSDGGISLFAAGDEEFIRFKINNFIGLWGASHYVSHRLMPDEALLTDRTFRDAWCDVTPEPVIDVDMSKAREIHREHLRTLRAPKLTMLDIAMSRAYADRVEQDRVEAKRQELRDVTEYPLIDAAQTPEALKLAIPDILKG